MAMINFSQVGSFDAVIGSDEGVLQGPTSLQFGPDERLYVSEQGGTINAFTIALQAGEYVAVDHEVLTLSTGGGVVQSIQNRNDDGSISDQENRQVTGFLVSGTPENPVLYVSSSDPRIGTNNDLNLDTNSSVITQVTWTGNEWIAVDIVRGLPRSEENHAVNGLTLSDDGNMLYALVGGNTNNGAPSQFFSNTPEFALSGTVLEIDLAAIAALPVNTDPSGGQGGVAREFVYDLPTLDDPTVPNVTDGIGEDEFGLDEAGPFGGNDGLNQAILPADAPLRIYADGLRNSFDIVLTEGGQLFTVDNGSNTTLGGDPIFVEGEPSSQINNGGFGAPEPLFRIDEGTFFGHPNPIRANQDQEFSIFDDDGNIIATVPNLADLVPAEVAIADGFVIDPSKFTGDPDRLAASGIRIPFGSENSPALATLGSSSNGLVEFTSNVFDGALQGALLVAQFNGNITLLNLNDEGTALEPLIDPGVDGVLGTADDEVLAENGIFPLITGQALPLDVTVDDNGNIFVAELGGNNIKVYSPDSVVTLSDGDFDNDGILNINDPFLRDPTNGGSVILSPDQTLLFDFDSNQDENLVGPSGYSGGLTGVAVNGITDYESFFQQPSPRPESGQDINLDNVKFATAGGGGTTVVEFASNGTADGSSNNGEYLFQTGVTIAPEVDNFNIRWSVFNPSDQFTGASQQIGGFIGTGDQSNFLKFVATPDPNAEIQLILENNDVIQVSSLIQTDGLFELPATQEIFFDLDIDTGAGTATPTVSYELGDGTITTETGIPIDLGDTAVLDAILGNTAVEGQKTGLAVGLFSTNAGQPDSNSFTAIFNDIELSANAATSEEPAPDDPDEGNPNAPENEDTEDILSSTVIGFEDQSAISDSDTSASPKNNWINNFDYGATDVAFQSGSPDHVADAGASPYYQLAEGESFAAINARNNTAAANVNDGLAITMTPDDLAARGLTSGSEINLSFQYSAGFNYAANGRESDSDTALAVWFGTGTVTNFNQLSSTPDDNILVGPWSPPGQVNGFDVMPIDAWQTYTNTIIWDGDSDIYLALEGLTGPIGASNPIGNETIFVDDIIVSGTQQVTDSDDMPSADPSGVVLF